MTTDVDICNRALQMIGARTNIASLAEDSTEAQNCSLAYLPMLNWCHALTNWNFARKTAVLAVAKSVAPPVATWTNASPAPPWLFECTLPADFIKAIYLTNSVHASTQKWDGALCRFQMARNGAGTVEVLLTNETTAILTYTSLVSDPTLWPGYFERIVVAGIAWLITMPLSANMSLLSYIDDVFTRMITLGTSANRLEGLAFEDATPEWNQARGIEYPDRRPDKRERQTQQTVLENPPSGTKRR